MRAQRGAPDVRFIRHRVIGPVLAAFTVLAALAAALAALLGTWHAATAAGWPQLPAGTLSAAACGLTAGCGVRLANRWAARR